MKKTLQASLIVLIAPLTAQAMSGESHELSLLHDPHKPHHRLLSPPTLCITSESSGTDTSFLADLKELNTKFATMESLEPKLATISPAVKAMYLTQKKLLHDAIQRTKDHQNSPHEHSALQEVLALYESNDKVLQAVLLAKEKEQIAIHEDWKTVMRTEIRQARPALAVIYGFSTFFVGICWYSISVLQHLKGI